MKEKQGNVGDAYGPRSTAISSAEDSGRMPPSIAIASELHSEYVAFIEGVQRRWVKSNRVRSNRVYEAMYPHEQQEVHDRIRQWGMYVTPIAERWWKERGYGCIWPEDDNDPMKLYRLDSDSDCREEPAAREREDS